MSLLPKQSISMLRVISRDCSDKASRVHFFYLTGRMFSRSFLFVCFLICGVGASGQGELVTDRPDQTESSSTVDIGEVQIETGIVLTRTPLGTGSPEVVERTNDYATTLLRIGLLERAELRLITAYSTFDPGFMNAPVISGLQPLSVGMKVKLSEEKGIRPEIAFIGHLTLPWIGDENFTPDYVAPDFRFSLAHTLSERFSLGYNLGMYWDGAAPQGNLLYTIALGAGVVGPMSVFAELYGEIRERTSWVHNADFGLTLLLTQDLQLDASYGLPLTEGLRGHFFSAGISARFACRKVTGFD